MHASGTFVMPNPWDIGSAKLLVHLGFPALATTSSGFAASLGKHDQHVTRDELVEHVRSLAANVDVPINVDAERCFAATPAGVAETLELIAEAGASGCSIEDYDPETKAIDPIEVATERVAAAAGAAHRHGVFLTARAENLLYRAGDLADTMTRLRAYSDAGADVVYAPGLVGLDEIAEVIRAVERPINVLMLPNGPSVAELQSVGVRRISTGGALAWAAYGALVQAAIELRDTGVATYAGPGLSRRHRAAFDES